jgi:protein required for attachment to host cells
MRRSLRRSTTRCISAPVWNKRAASVSLPLGAARVEDGPVEHVAREFANTLGKDLEQARVNSEYDELALIAPPRMLGYLREAMNAQTRGLVYGEVAKDIDQNDAMGIRKHLDQLVAKT